MVQELEVSAFDDDQTGISDSLLLRAWEDMLLLRRIDERTSELCEKGEIPGLIHLGVGEEAVAVGTCLALRPEDKVTSTHRAHGHFLAKGADPGAFMAELYGKATGSCGGKGGSMHLIDTSIGFLGANGVVGAGLPIAVGAALGAKILGEDFVVACFFGDGANNQGTFHESMNLAAVWKLPVIFVCENNGYGISQSIHSQQLVDNVSDRAPGYGIPARIIDGNDFNEVYLSVSAAANNARAGGGPMLIECSTYRVSGHYEGDSETYRDEAEVAEWKRKDPLLRTQAEIEKRGAFTADVVAAIEARVDSKVEAATEFARKATFPPPGDALRHVYAEAS